MNYWMFSTFVPSNVRSPKNPYVLIRKLISCMVLQFLFPIFINILRMQMCLMRTLISWLILQSCISNLLLFKWPFTRNIVTCDCNYSFLFSTYYTTNV
jgi:hypothetical protein